jgi:hypothetical protein
MGVANAVVGRVVNWEAKGRRRGAVFSCGSEIVNDSTVTPKAL